MNAEKQQLLDTILAWAESSPDVRALALIGSESKPDGLADRWSDLDLALVVRDPSVYLSSPHWIADIGEYTLHTVERGADGEIHERRAVFSSGVDVDFIILPAERCLQGFGDTWIAGIAAQGMKTLLDKDAMLPESMEPPATKGTEQPTLLEFQEVIADFWFHIVWTTKKLMRGELWTAKHCCDVHMKGLLLRMIEWHARATKGWDLDVRYGGRFLEQWADPGVVAELPDIFAQYDEDDIWRALFSSGNLFRRMAEETARCLSYDWLPGQSQAAMEWARNCQSQGPSASKD
jgi:aminoglycoside 6-adenylyltransferase